MTSPLPSPARRTSPLIIGLHTVTFRQARSFVPAVIGIGAAVGFRNGTATVVAMVIGVTLLSLATATLAWWRFGYTDGPASVVVTRGMLSRSVRTVPNDRIRGVELETPALHRVFGLVRVRIDAAAGAVQGKDEELVIDGVTAVEADRLRRSVLTHRAAAAPLVDAGGAPAPAEEEFTRFDNRWLLYAPLVGSYLALPLAAVGALYRLAGELPRELLPDLPGPDRFTARGLAIAAVVAVALLVVGSVIGAALVNFGFRLLRRGGSLIVVRGLITRRHTELEIDRIRGATVSDGLGMRLVSAARTNALMTGLGDAGRRGQLLPLGPRSSAWALARRLVEDPGPLTAHPPAARRRRLVRATLPGLLVTVVGIVVAATAGVWQVVVAGAVLAALGVPVGLGRYASLGHGTGPRSFAVRNGWLVRTHTVLQRRAVVGWRVEQTLFQRRAGLATVVACVGAGSGGYGAVDMAAGDVAAFTAAASEEWASAFQR
jgi:putative membrane protein